MLSATRSAMSSFEITPMISDGRPRPCPDDDGHAGVVARHALYHVEHDVGFARQSEIALCDVTKMDAAIGLLDAAAQSDIDAHHTGDVIAAHYHYVLESGTGCVGPQESIEISICRQ